MEISNGTRASLYFIAGAIISGAITFGATRAVMLKKYSEAIEKETEELREYFKRKYKVEEYSDPTTYAEVKGLIDSEEETHDGGPIDVEIAKGLNAAEEILKEQGYLDPETESKESSRKADEQADDIKSVWGESTGIPISHEAMSEREESDIYVISIEEFMDDTEEEPYDKITLAYFEEDDVLCDDRNSMIPDVEGTVRQVNLLRFGQGSDSPDVVYVRNERIHTDFEIARDDGSFTDKILGLKKPSVAKHRPKRLKEDD